MIPSKINPFKHEYFLGYISQVFPQFVKIHFPSSVLLNGFTHLGREFNGGLVGNFIVIEGEKYGFLGRITELTLPENERLSLNEKAFQTSDFHPTGKVEILLSFDHFNPFQIKKGLASHPNIGAKVFVCSSDFVQKYMSRFGLKETDTSSPISIGKLVSNPDTTVSVNLQSIFSRHCAIVGTTGGGKSYTVSKLVEVLTNSNNKAILIDATGEYSNSFSNAQVINIGKDNNLFHYSQLTIEDLFYLVKPSPKVQVPKLMEAVRSLKMVKLNEGKNFTTIDNKVTPNVTHTIEVKDGLMKKLGQNKRPYNAYFFNNISKIENGNLDFDFTKLNSQINEECIWDNGINWSTKNENDLSWCVGMITTINNLINTQEYNSVFGFSKPLVEKDNIVSKMDAFLADSNTTKNLMILNFQYVNYEYQVREILANAIGKFLLSKSRNGAFEKSPLVFFVDEAHQFLNKSIASEYFSTQSLSSFDSIAKECRKQGLFLCIATQMPRDIPIGTLSQMGTFIVHRLINQYDKESISNACSSSNKSTLDFLPILGEGEALLTGVDFPMPIILKIDIPNSVPNSETPKLK